MGMDLEALIQPSVNGLGGVNEQEFSNQTRKIEKHAYYQNYCTEQPIPIQPNLAQR